MKKLISMFIILAISILLSGCGKEPTKVELTADNFESYFNMSAQVTDFRTEDRKTILGTDYYGYANLKVKVTPKKDITTEDVIIKGKVTLVGLCWSGNNAYFDITLDKDGKAEIERSITSGKCSLLRPENPGITVFYTYDLKDNEFFAYDKKFVIDTLSGSIYE